MLAPSSKPLRSAILNLKLQPAVLTPCTATPTSIRTQRRLQSTSHTISLSRPSHRLTALPKSSQKSTTAIHAASLRTITQSASPSPQDPTIQTSATPSPSPSPTTTPLTWNAYLALRKTRRRYNLFFSLSSSIVTTAAGVSYLAQQSLENISVFGLDPFIVLGISVVGSGGVGWLLGPFLGNAVFGLRYRRLGGEIAEKERDLFRRIKQHRVDPSGGSSSNPVPDYYGEKIDSVKGYRNWMKDQRAFNKKRQNFL